MDQHIQDVLARSKAVDKKQYRALKLSNEMRVLLVSDPDAPQCAVSLNVDIGSMADPRKHLGLAHYLEHVLFMGTEKYPKVGEYSEYIQNNQGMSNAYTASQATNYQLQINETAFEGAVDRLAQFFIAPKFDAAFLEKEKNAVNSEYDKNILNDSWRGFQIFKTLLKQDHPASQFNIGNNETLGATSREDVMTFYQNSYSANLMSLAMYCRTSLDEMEKLAKSYFSAVPNRNFQKPKYDENVVEQGSLPVEVVYKPVKEKRELEFAYFLPPTISYYPSKPLVIISYLLGREGKGSLLAKLKDLGLATGLSSSYYEEDHGTIFGVSVDLTPEGMENVDQVKALYFSYLKMMKEKGYPEYIFDLKRTMMANEFIFRETPAPVNLVVYYASAMSHFSGDQVDVNMHLLHEYRSADFDKFLALLTPEQTVVLLASPDAKTDQKEKYFGIDYSTKKIQPETVKAWASVAMDDGFAYPEKNDYLPTDLLLLEAAKPVEFPANLGQNTRGENWFLNDQRFPMPKAYVGALLLSPKMNDSLQSGANTKIWVRLFHDSLTSWLDELQEVGIDLSFGDTENGLEIRLSGFSQHLPRVLEEFAVKLRTFTPTQARFDLIKTEMKKDLDNTYFADPYRISVATLRVMEQQGERLFTDYLTVLPKLDLAGVVAHQKSFLQGSSLKLLSYGNLSDAMVTKFPDVFAKALGLSELAVSENLPDLVPLVGAAGQRPAFVMTTKNNNYSWASKVVFGKRSPQMDAVLTVLDSYWQPRYFNELRDNKQLGYVVHAGAAMRGRVAGFMFLLQSQKYKADELAKYSHDWLESELKGLSKLDDATFAALRDGAIQVLEKPEVSMSDRYDRLWGEMRILGSNYNHRTELLQSLKSLTLKDFVRAVQTNFDSKSRSVNSVYVVPEEGQKPKLGEREVLVKDMQALKATLLRL